MSMKVQRVGLLLVLVTLCAAGCGEKPPVLAEVEGVVLFNGKAQEGIQVEYLPDPEKATKGPKSSGLSDAQGRYRLKTDKNEDGAVVGFHRVTLFDTKATQVSQDQLAAGKRATSRIEVRFTSGNSTPLKKEVKAGKNDIPLDFGKP